jgi:AhpD family alkylhydroperoxidase
MTITDALVDIPVRLDFDAIVPRYARAVASLDHAATAELDRVGVDTQLRELVRLRASQLNGCVYCVDLHSKDARKAGVTEQKLHALAVWQESGLFTAAERAVLRLTESVTRLSETHVPEQDLADVIAILDEERTAALVALIVTINVWDAIGVTTRCWPVTRDVA